MKTSVTFRLSDEALAAIEYIAKHYGYDKTAAITTAVIEWAAVLRERERQRLGPAPQAAGNKLG